MLRELQPDGRVRHQNERGVVDAVIELPENALFRVLRAYRLYDLPDRADVACGRSSLQAGLERHNERSHRTTP